MLPLDDDPHPKRPPCRESQGHRLFQRKVRPAQFERQPTIGKRREIRVGRRGETPLVPPYKFHRPNKAMALGIRVLSLIETARSTNVWQIGRFQEKNQFSDKA